MPTTSFASTIFGYRAATLGAISRVTAVCIAGRVPSIPVCPTIAATALRYRRRFRLGGRSAIFFSPTLSIGLTIETPTRQGPIAEVAATRDGRGQAACFCIITGSSSGRARSVRRLSAGQGCPTRATGRLVAIATSHWCAACLSIATAASEIITAWF